jgi:ABC-2 type transport system ATP-binding protein
MHSNTSQPPDILDQKHDLPNDVAALEIKSASKSYKHLDALLDVSFQIKQGDFFALLGPNGAGKSTLINSIAGLNFLSGGQIKVMGYDVAQQPILAKKQLGIVPQELVFDPFFTVEESVRFQASYYGIDYKKQKDWIEEILTELSLIDKLKTNTRKLSGGMKRRLMVAQALVHKPAVIILDEPTAGVDVELRQSMWQFLSQLNQQGHTILLTTHYLEEAQSLCKNVALLNKGRLVTLKSMSELLQQFSGQQLKVRAINLPKTLQSKLIKQQGMYYFLSVAHPEEIPLMVQQFAQENILIEELQTQQADLEHVFLSLTE